MEVKPLYLDILGFKCEISFDNYRHRSLIKEDFSYFVKDSLKKNNFTISVEKASNYKLPEGLVATKQTQNAITYQADGIKYNDYYGKIYTEFKHNDLRLFYHDEAFVHEALYLIILSYSGKAMDRRGLHKVHACGISNADKNLIFMMPSKGGKTTLFSDLIMDPDINIISDDTPVITVGGRVKAFPLCIGAEDKNSLIKRFPYLDESVLYEFSRVHYSKKYLLSLQYLKNKIQVAPKNVLVSGRRYSSRQSKVIKVSKFKMLRELARHMVVGIGLPMIIEHFFRIGWKDYFVNLQILLSRSLAAFMICMRSDCYLIYLGSDRMKNREKVLELIK